MLVMMMLLLILCY